MKANALKLIFAGYHDASRELFADEISSLIRDGRRSLLIVPEQYTLYAEREMARLLPKNAPLYFEVTNFTRLADRVFRSLGGLAQEHADRARRALIMWECLSELMPALRTVGRGEITAGLVTRTMAALKEIEGFGITGRELEDAEAKIREGNVRLADKLCDLALIKAMYEEKLKERYNEKGSELELAREKLERSRDFLSDEVIFVDGFTSLTDAQYKLLSTLLSRCEVKVAINLTRDGMGGFEFTELRSLRRGLIRAANLAELEVKEEEPFASSERAPEVYERLWSVGCEALPESSRLPKLYEAETPYEECRFLAEEIRRRVLEGARYSDFAIIARNAETYIGTLDDALKKCGIPHFISRTRDIFSFEAVKLLFAALEVADGEPSREDIISFLKCGFSGLTREACDEFELYTDVWQLSGGEILGERDFNMSPDGYTSFKSDGSDEFLERVNTVRRELCKLLNPFRRACAAAKSTRELAALLVGFASELQLEEKIAKRSEELLALGEGETADECASLWQIICSALDTLVEASDTEADAASFKNRLELVLGEAKIGKLPSYRDVVTLGSADSLRIGKKRFVYIIGANRGEFPALPKDLAYFGDRDKRELADVGLAIEGGSEFEYARELFYFSRALSSAIEPPAVIYTRCGFDFKELSPSEAIERIIKLSGGKVSAEKISEMELKRKLYSLEAAASAASSLSLPELEESLTELGYGDALRANNGKITNDALLLSEDTAKKIYEGDLKLSQTSIDKFIDCPLAYFLKYKLGLKETETASFDARNIGSFVHSILESFFRELKGTDKNAMPTPEEREKISERAAEEYLRAIGADMKRSARVASTLKRLQSSAMPIIDALAEERASSDFEPEAFELRIGSRRDGGPRAAKIRLDDESEIVISGSIDRVDTYKSGKDVYVRVIDYKTGKKSFSPDDLAEGRNLQMFLYLKSILDTSDRGFLDSIGLEEGGKLLPAGVMYVSVSFDEVRINHDIEADAVKEVKKNQKRQGMFLDSAESLAAMNPKLIPISFDKENQPDQKSKRLLYSYGAEAPEKIDTPPTEAENTEASVESRTKSWEDISELLTETVKRVGEGIKSGKLPALPLKTKKTSPCTYCSFKSVCRNAKI